MSDVLVLVDVLADELADELVDGLADELPDELVDVDVLPDELPDGSGLHAATINVTAAASTAIKAITPKLPLASIFSIDVFAI